MQFVIHSEIEIGITSKLFKQIYYVTVLLFNSVHFIILSDCYLNNISIHNKITDTRGTLDGFDVRVHLIYFKQLQTFVSNN